MRARTRTRTWAGAALGPLIVLGLSTASACKGDPASTGRGERGTAAAVSNGRCAHPGMAHCYCDDGTLSGNQICKQDGTLTPCTCSGAFGNAAAATMPATGGTKPAAPKPSTGPLCKALEG